MKTDIKGNAEKIKELLLQTEPFEKQRLENIKKRLTENLNKFSFNGKLSYELDGMTEFILSYNGSWHEWDSFAWLWKNYPNNTSRTFRKNQNVTFQFQAVVGQDVGDLALGEAPITQVAGQQRPDGREKLVHDDFFDELHSLLDGTGG